MDTTRVILQWFSRRTCLHDTKFNKNLHTVCKYIFWQMKLFYVARIVVIFMGSHPDDCML